MWVLRVFVRVFMCMCVLFNIGCDGAWFVFVIYVYRVPSCVSLVFGVVVGVFVSV